METGRKRLSGPSHISDNRYMTISDYIMTISDYIMTILTIVAISDLSGAAAGGAPGRGRLPGLRPAVTAKHIYIYIYIYIYSERDCY